jgi:site-specific DNA recombinase
MGDQINQQPARCILYARVSTEEQTERFGLTSQLSELRSHAGTLGYDVLHELVDDGYSGADLGRPALNALRDLARSKAIEAVLVHDPDRLARKLAHQLVLTEELERAGVRLEFVTAPNTDSMEGRLLLNVRGVIAEYEREKIRERTMRGRREKAHQGFIVGGRRPYGYQTMNGVYTVDERESQVVLQMFHWLVDEGLSIRRIIERLNHQGEKPHTSPRWAKSTVGRILRNELYVGICYYNRRQRVEPDNAPCNSRRNKKTRHRWKSESEWISLPVPPIVPSDLYQAAQLRLKQNSVHCSGRPPKNIYLLRGILRCSRCGRKFVGVPIFKDKYYRCIGHERLANPYCGAPSISAKAIESFVWGYVTRLLSNPDLLAEKLIEQGEEDHNLEAELARIDKQFGEAQRREDRLLEALLDGDVPLPGLRQRAKELEVRRLGLQASREALLASLAMQRDQARLRETVFSYCKVLGTSICTLDLPAQQKLIQALLDEVTLDGDQVCLKGILPMPPNPAKLSTTATRYGCPRRQPRVRVWPWFGRAHR